MLEKVVKLNNNVLIPSIGFGTSLIVGQSCIDLIKDAIEVGYTHIDTASVYNNQKEIGEAIKQKNIKREEIFITSKVWKDEMGYENTLKSFNKSLKSLNLEYIDLFLIHWPKNADEKINIETWQALEKLYKEGKVRAIGVSNFLKRHLEHLIENTEIKPMVNQIEFHPGYKNYRQDLLDFCRQNDILVEAWAPLGKGKMLQEKELVDIAKKYNKSVAQICIRWCLQNNIVPLPKSSNKGRMKENKNVYDFEIEKEDMKIINNLKYNQWSGMDPELS